MAHSSDTDQQHLRPEYLAGMIKTLIIALGAAARHAGISRSFDEDLETLRRIAEEELDGRVHFIDYHTGSLHAAEQIRREMY